MSIPASADNHRTAEEAAREAARTEVSDVLLNLEHTLARSKKALARIHDTYYSGDSLRLI